MLYAVFKVNGRTRWKLLATDDVVYPRRLEGGFWQVLPVAMLAAPQIEHFLVGY